jgi:UDP-glucose 4-epimerase
MKVVITGGAGFIGANLVRGLVDVPGLKLVVIDDLSTGDAANLAGLDVPFVNGSVLDPSLLDDVLIGADAVVHLAAIPSVPRSLADPVASHEANAGGTLLVLEAARRAGGPHVIVASSSSVYGANVELPKREEMRAHPLSPYAVSKLAAETYALAYGYCFGMDVLAFRFFNVFGPLQSSGHAYAAVIPSFVHAALTEQPLRVHGDGSQTRDFTYVGTVVAVLTDAVIRRVTSDMAVNLAFGTRTSLLEVIAELEAVIGRPVTVSHDPSRPGDVHDSQADNSRLRELFPNLAPVGLSDGLRATVHWMAAQRSDPARSPVSST